MYFQGTVRNGVIAFDGELPLPEGTVVRVVPINNQTQPAANLDQLDPLFNMGELAVVTELPNLSSSDHTH